MNFSNCQSKAHDQHMILMGHNTDNSMMSSVEKVFLTKNAGTGDDNRKKQNYENRNWKKEEQGNSSSPSPKRTAQGTGLPGDREVDYKNPKTVVNENEDTKCKFCEARESLHLQDESGNNFEFKKGQRKHYLEARHKNIIQFPDTVDTS